MRTLFEQIKSELAVPADRWPWLTNLIAALAVLTPIALLGNGLADVVISTAAALFLVRAILARDASWAREPWIAVAAVLWLYLVARGFLSVDPERSGLKALGWIRFIVFGAALHFVLARSVALRQALLYSIIAMAAFGAADALFQFVVGHDIFGRPIVSNRLSGPLQNPAIGVLLLFVGLPAIIQLLKTIVSGYAAGRIEWIPAAILAMIFATIILSGERLTLLMTVPIMGLVAVLTFRVSWKTLAGIAIVGVAVLAILLAAFPDVRQRHLSTLKEFSSPTQSIYTRIMVAGLEVIKDNPVFGVGIKNFKAHCPQSAPEAVVGDACKLIHPHQVWLHIVSETGLIGGIGFLSLFVLALTPAVRLWRSWADEPLLAGATIAVLMRLLPFTPSGNFFSNWRESFFWFLLGTSAAMARIAMRDQKPSAIEPARPPTEPKPSPSVPVA